MRMLIAVVAVLALVVVAQAQEPSFEVASVKVIEGRVGGFGLLPSGQVRFDGTSLRYIIQEAFDVPPQVGEHRLKWSSAAERLIRLAARKRDRRAWPGGREGSRPRASP